MKVSIITSVYKGEKYIKHFLNDITKQTIFNECELVIINAASPENEEKHIMPFVEKYKNIKYFKLKEDPGIYAVWNLAIENSTAPYITNANLDDSKSIECIEKQASTLDKNPNVDLVYGETMETFKELETFDNNSSTQSFPCLDFSFQNLLKVNSPHSSPMWRREMHKKYGDFNPDYKYCGDYEMWLRAAQQGSIFKKINSKLSLYLRNKNGLSTKEENIAGALKEIQKIKNQYTSKPKIKETAPPLVNFGDLDFKFKEMTEIAVINDISKLNKIQTTTKYIFPTIKDTEDAYNFPVKIQNFLKKTKYKGGIITRVNPNLSKAKNKIIRLNQTKSPPWLSTDQSIFNCFIDNRIIASILFAIEIAKRNNTNEIFIKDLPPKEKLLPIERKFIIDVFYSSHSIIEISNKEGSDKLFPQMSNETAEKYITFNKQNEKISPNNLVPA